MLVVCCQFVLQGLIAHILLATLSKRRLDITVRFIRTLVARPKLTLLLNHLHVVDVYVLAIALFLPILWLDPLLRKRRVLIDAVVSGAWKVDGIAARISLIVTLRTGITSLGFTALQNAIGRLVPI